MSADPAVVQLCRDFIVIAVDEARRHGRNPAQVLQAYRRAMQSDRAPLNGVLIAALDRAILDLAQPVAV